MHGFDALLRLDDLFLLMDRLQTTLLVPEESQLPSIELLKEDQEEDPEFYVEAKQAGIMLSFYY